MSADLTVKGTSRRVVIVPTDADSIFEQVICIVRDDVPAVTAEAILREAERALSPPPDGEEGPPRALLTALLVILCAAVAALLILLIWLSFQAP